MRLISQKKLKAFISACEASPEINLKTLLLSENNQLRLNYSVAPYDLETPQLLFSVTKSITSLAIGIASDLNLLSLEDTVVSFFPDQLPKQVGKHLSMMTIRDLLTMTVGIQEDTYPQLVIKKDWVKAFLAQDFPQKAGFYYCYSTHASHMLSAVITKVSGQLLSEFLMEQLFSKMGISYPQWEQSPEGYTCGGMGLSLATNDLLKIGQLLANYGNYQGQQLISTNYLEQATTGQIVKQNVSRTDILGYQYGFQFHILQDGAYRADGAFGQLCLVHPETNMVIVATSNGTKMATLIELIYDYLIKPRQKEQQVSTLTITNTQKFDFKGKENNYFNRKWLKPYTIQKNKWSIETCQFLAEITTHYLILTRHAGNAIKLKFKPGHQLYGETYFIKDIEEHKQTYCTKSQWLTLNKLSITVYFIETPYILTIESHFKGTTISVLLKINLSFTLENSQLFGQSSQLQGGR